MAIVYLHTKKGTDEVFYVGIGKDETRAFTKHGRTDYWKNIVKKYDYDIAIISDDLTWEEACEEEKTYILLFGRRDNEVNGQLVNLTDGGEGAIGYKHSDESRKKISEASKNISDKTRSILSQKSTGRKHSEESKKLIGTKNSGKIQSQESINKRIIKLVGKKHSAEHIQKIASKHKGMIRSNETKKRISEALKGKTLSIEHKLKLSEIKKGKPTNRGVHIVQYDLNNNLINRFESITKASEQTNVHKTSIYSVLRGQKEKTRGYIWKYDS